MLHKIRRVSKFWHEYGGKKPVDNVDNALLRDDVDWRRDYYHRMSKEKRPKNYSLNPADKKLGWETTFALTVLKFAQERGYRGNKPVPTFRHKAQRTKTRPAFTLKEYSVLYKGIRRWMHEEKDNARWRYKREVLRDYVLILANSGMRVGEANNPSVGALEKFTDERGWKNYAFNVNGKTGKRYVILRANARRYVERTLERNAHWQAEWKLTAELNKKQFNRKTAQHDHWLFCMLDGNKIITLIDQFNEILKRENITHNADGEK